LLHVYGKSEEEVEISGKKYLNEVATSKKNVNIGRSRMKEVLKRKVKTQKHFRVISVETLPRLLTQEMSHPQ